MPTPLQYPPAKHWESIYSAQPVTGVSWYRPHLERSLYWIDRMLLEAGISVAAAQLIDVGTGESTLADDLLALGLAQLTLLDLSPSALAHLRTRIETQFGETACACVKWLTGDVTQMPLPAATFDVWHDRAVLHFLTGPADRAAYARQAAHSVRPGGALVVATFAADGPTQSSQLDVKRSNAEDLAQLFAGSFDNVASEQETHTTPSGVQQRFQYWVGRQR